VTEIKDTARRILVAEGVDGLSLRAIAREMGMTAPALYRYFPSREDLVVHLIADLYGELAEAMAAARDAQGPEDTPGRLSAACRAFRQWAVGHPREFALLFGSPIPGLEAGRRGGEVTVAHEAGDRFGGIFAELVARIYVTRPFAVPAEADIDPLLRQELAEWCTSFPVPLPIGVAKVFLSCWIRLYGTVAMEVFGHLKFAVADAEPVFEAELRDLAGKLGVGADYRPPTPRPAPGPALAPAPAAPPPPVPRRS
jgi:AcrR family transcriptional regulator